MAPWSRRKKSDPAVRLFFATDVHGSDRCFRKFLAAAEAYNAKILVLGGDVADKAYREQVFRREIRAQLEGWCELAGERLPADVRCIITPGNDDPVEIDAVLESAEKVECPERELCDLGPVVLASIGDVTPTPWDTEREYSEEELGERIAAMMDRVEPGRSSVVNFHNPPYGSGLDTAPELDANLKPVLHGGRPSFVPVGSRAVRDAIKRYQPTVGLHGHRS